MNALSRAAAVAALAGAVLCASAPASADTTSPAPSPVTSTATAAASSAAVPPFPGFGASPEELNAWGTAASTALGLPKPPAIDAAPEAWDRWFDDLLVALDVPSDDASDAEWHQWFAGLASKLGLPEAPAIDASDAEWDAWFEEAFGVDVTPGESSMAWAFLGTPYCSAGKGYVPVEAENFGEVPVVLTPFVDDVALKATISVPGTPAGSTELGMADGKIPVPDGEHTVSITDTTNGVELDAVEVDLACAGPSDGTQGTTPGTGSPPAPAPGSSRPAQDLQGPLVQTGYVPTRYASAPATGISLPGALTAGALVSLFGLITARRRFTR